MSSVVLFTLICTHNEFPPSISNTHVFAFEFMQRRSTTVWQVLMDGLRDSDDTIGQVVRLPESLYMQVKRLVSKVRIRIIGSV